MSKLLTATIGVIAAVCGFVALLSGMLLLQRGWPVPELWWTAVISFGLCALAIGAMRARRIAGVYAGGAFLMLYLWQFGGSYFSGPRATVLAIESSILQWSKGDHESRMHDPFASRRSLSIRNTPAGTTIWSVGPDGGDNFGRKAVDVNALRHVDDRPLRLLPFLKRAYWSRAWPGDIVYTCRGSENNVECRAVSFQRDTHTAPLQ